ncbi:hypothetical protein HC891_18760, partial [Candidatus Gracilibacteria bacterium]|nr:hypothetical protein [Candidatus Gracilibacteria bacterium]
MEAGPVQPAKGQRPKLCRLFRLRDGWATAHRSCSPAAVELTRLNFDSDADMARLTLLDFDLPIEDFKGNWQIKDGQLHQMLAGRARNSSSHTVAAVTGDASWRDYTLSCQFLRCAS